MNTYTYEELSIGKEESFEVQISADMADKFLSITGDENPLHNDPDYAMSKGYPDKVLYGMLSASFLSTLAGVYLPGKNSLIHEVSVSFTKPVFIDDTLTVSGKIVEKNDLFQYITLKVSIKNQRGEKVCRGKMQIGVTQ